MDYERILQHISRHITLDKTEEDFFLSLLQYRRIKKKEFIVKEGEVCKAQHYVVKGCFKWYSIDDNGGEHVISFAPEDYWMGDLYSFLTDKPSRFNTVALEDSEIFVLTRSNIQRLYEQVPKFERFFRIIFQNALVRQYERVDDNLSLSGEEKYLQFCEKYPQLEQRLSQKQIAAYLGITPEFLSIVRRRLLTR